MLDENSTNICMAVIILRMKKPYRRCVDTESIVKTYFCFHSNVVNYILNKLYLRPGEKCKAPPCLNCIFVLLFA